MATFTLEIQNRGVALATWSELANTDEGTGVAIGQYPDKTVQVTGTFGASGEATIEGSNDGTNWATLTDPQGNDLVITAADIKLITESPVHVRPNITAGDGTTDLEVVIAAVARD